MSKIEKIVINKIETRAEIGERKYNTTMERDDLTRKAWLIHGQEESLDLAIYLEKLIQLEEEEAFRYNRYKNIVCKFDEFMCNNETPENVHSYWSEMFNMFPARMEEE